MPSTKPYQHIRHVLGDSFQPRDDSFVIMVTDTTKPFMEAAAAELHIEITYASVLPQIYEVRTLTSHAKVPALRDLFRSKLIK